MTKRTDEKALYLAALRGDAKAQRTCTEKGKLCGGRCIPKSWNCRIKGEGDTPPTRGNKVQLSAEQIQKVRQARRAGRTRAFGLAAAGAGALGAIAFLSAKNPQKSRRLFKKGPMLGQALGVGGVVPGPTRRAAVFGNVGLAGAHIAGAAGANYGQNIRGRKVYANYLKRVEAVDTKLKSLDGRHTKLQEKVLNAKQAEDAAKIAATRLGTNKYGRNNATRSIAQQDRVRKQNLKSARKRHEKAQRELNGFYRETGYSSLVKEKIRLTKAATKVKNILLGPYNTKGVVGGVLNDYRLAYNKGYAFTRRQLRGLNPFPQKRGPKPGTHFARRSSLIQDADNDRLDKKCGKSGIPDNWKCTKAVQVVAENKAAVAVGAVYAGAAGVALGAGLLASRNARIRGKLKFGGDDRITPFTGNIGDADGVLKNFQPKQKGNESVFGDVQIGKSGEKNIVVKRISGNKNKISPLLDPVAIMKKQKLIDDKVESNLIKQRNNLMENEVTIAQAAGEIGFGPKVVAAKKNTLIMEVAEGNVLMNKYANAGPLGPRITAKELDNSDKKAVLASMAKMHTAGIAHNDMHLGNTFIGSEKGAQFIDFGTSQRGGGPVAMEFVRQMNPPRFGETWFQGNGYNLKTLDPKGYAQAEQQIKSIIGKRVGKLRDNDIAKAVQKNPALESQLQDAVDNYYRGLVSSRGDSSGKNKFGPSSYVQRELGRMRARGTGRYGALARPRRTGPSYRPDQDYRFDVVFTNKELHARVKAEAKRKFKVYPSAYANAWMVKEYKKRGGGFRNDDLKKWFNEKWVRMSAKGEILGECGDRGKGEGKPRCLPLAKARALSKKERASTVKAKRRKDPKKNRSGAAKMVPNTFDSEGKKYSKTVVNPETGRKRTVKCGAKGYRIAPGTDKGDRYCARSFGDMKSHNKNCAGKDRNTPLCLSRAKWKCSGKSSRKDAGEKRLGKPCGASYIPKSHKCNKGQGAGRTVKQQKAREAVPQDKEYKQLAQIEKEMDRENAAKSGGNTGKKIAAAALAAGAVASAASFAASPKAKKMARVNAKLIIKGSNKRVRNGLMVGGRGVVAGLSTEKVKEGLAKLPDGLQGQARKLVGGAKKAAAGMALKAEGYKIQDVDVEGNFSTWKDKRGTMISIGSYGDSLVTYASDPSHKWNGKQVYIVGFNVDQNYDAERTMPKAQSSALISGVKRMNQNHLKKVGDGILATTPWDGDGDDMQKKRRAVYKRIGYNNIVGETSQWALVENGKIKKMKDSEAFIYLAESGEADAPMYKPRKRREDAGEKRLGKPCGSSYISKSKQCRIQNGSVWNKLAVAGAVAGVVAGGYALSQRNPDRDRKPRLSPAERNAARLARQDRMSEERAKKIAKEAIEGGNVWDVQEKINKRRKAGIAEQCGGGLGKIQAPAKFDAMVRQPRCQLGEGAYGTYFVHTSGKYGVKVFRNGAEDDVEKEFDLLDRAKAAGVNVPQPLAQNAVLDEDGYTKSQTLVLEHMKGYKEAGKLYPNGGYNLSKAPLIVQVKALREFRKLNVEGLAHGDIHGGNILVNPRSKKVALIDFGYATAIDDFDHPQHGRSGVETLMDDLHNVRDFLGVNTSFLEEKAPPILENIRRNAENYNRDWDKFEVSVKRYYDFVESELLYGERRPRSKFVRSADQLRIPDLTRRILTANRDPQQRRMMVQVMNELPSKANVMAENLGIKKQRLFLALKPEREQLAARIKGQPFGTPL